VIVVESRIFVVVVVFAVEQDERVVSVVVWELKDTGDACSGDENDDGDDREE
jgi:hypothetical protein